MCLDDPSLPLRLVQENQASIRAQRAAIEAIPSVAEISSSHGSTQGRQAVDPSLDSSQIRFPQLWGDWTKC